MAFWVYVLECGDGSYYTGHTDNLERRIAQHEVSACGGYTATRRPIRLAWAAEFATRQEALEREMQVKRWSRAKKKALCEGDWTKVCRLARKQFKKR
jgi:predicted GIY-YIG superfamily endonuclease